MSKNLALFDFDGTITHADCFTRFVFFAATPWRLLLGAPCLILAFLLYKAGVLPASKTRPLVAWVLFWRREAVEVMELGARFANEVLPAVIRDEAKERLDWHRQQGDRIVVVSASLNPYLSVWCHQQSVELLCSELAVNGQRLTGRYVDGDCSLVNKVRRIQQHLDLEDFSTVYAYGDTHEDFPMLALADQGWYQWQRHN
ncbi:HAD-IB family hydrolase [Thaumasiovibrio subtropicus]|uniref:HAD-IB family hydrolase n=1 Tax=Thaumasiovibrio subtropicus TaxID=1891207 RepID=UPI000B34E046|nr:HAD-IB family hydrolase [Thaumasiovibrio subtropicus]